MSTRMLLAALALSWLSAPVMAQTKNQPQNQPREGDRAERQDRPERRDRGDRRRNRRDDRAGWERYRNASPEERQKLRSERMLEMTARTYDLSDEQKEMVRAEMDRMREERRVQMGPMADRYDELRNKMFERFSSAQQVEGQEADRNSRRRMRDDPEMKKLRDEMREIEQKFPFDWDASVKRVEALLPPEQAAKGHARFEERRQRWQNRRQDREGEMENMMLDAMRESEAALAEGRATDALKVLKRAERRLNRRGLSDDVRQQLQARIEQARQQIEPAASQEQANATPRAEHPWEKYVKEFSTNRGLSATQQSSAAAILKDMRSRAAQIEVANAAKIAAATEIVDAKERDEKIKELNAPIEKLFDELKIRLDGLLTAEQRAKTAKS